MRRRCLHRLTCCFRRRFVLLFVLFLARSVSVVHDVHQSFMVPIITDIFNLNAFCVSIDHATHPKMVSRAFYIVVPSYRRNGINVRHIGQIRAHCTGPIRELLLLEMCVIPLLLCQKLLLFLLVMRDSSCSFHSSEDCSLFFAAFIILKETTE